MTIDYNQKPLLDHNSKFLILTSNFNNFFFNRLIRNIEKVSIGNYLILLRVEDKIYIKFSNDSSIFILKQSNHKILSEVYQNLPKKYPDQVHNIFVLQQIPRVIYSEGRILSILSLFLQDVVVKIEGSVINYLFMKDEKNADSATISSILDQLILQRQFEITSNTYIEPIHNAPRLMTYEENSQCIMVPQHKLVPKQKRMFLKVKSMNPAKPNSNH